MSGATRFVKAASALSVAFTVLVSAYVWQTRSVHRWPQPAFGRTTTNRAVAADVSKPLSTLSSGGESVDSGLETSAATARFVVVRPKAGCGHRCTERVCQTYALTSTVNATESAEAAFTNRVAPDIRTRGWQGRVDGRLY